jgi:hypothetical protein
MPGCFGVQEEEMTIEEEPCEDAISRDAGLSNATVAIIEADKAESEET